MKNLKYNIYTNSPDNLLRYSLGNAGANPLLVIGLNPSIATNEKSDTTISKVNKVAKISGFDGFVMLNLYPERATDYSALPLEMNPEIYNSNLSIIEKIVASQVNPTIWAAWGESVNAREYFLKAGKDLSNKLRKYKVSWMKFGELTKSGHPRHPSRISYEWKLSSFDIEKYFNNISP